MHQGQDFTINNGSFATALRRQTKAQMGLCPLRWPQRSRINTSRKSGTKLIGAVLCNQIVLKERDRPPVHRIQREARNGRDRPGRRRAQSMLAPSLTQWTASGVGEEGEGSSPLPLPGSSPSRRCYTLARRCPRRDNQSTPPSALASRAGKIETNATLETSHVLYDA